MATAPKFPSDSFDPLLVAIPAAWFLMGSASGQDCERPIHRVWIDAFLLAATQVTNAEYERFVNSTASDPPPFWHDANFNGVLPKGTPVAQCIPVKRETWDLAFETLSSDTTERMIETRNTIGQDTGVYRRQFRAPKR